MNRSEKQLLEFLSFGAFLVIVGTVFLITPNLIGEFETFFRDIQFEQVNGNLYFPAPQNPHPTLYKSTAIFCFTYGVYQILLLILKFALKASPRRKAKTFTSIIFWPATSYAMLLLKDQTIQWFTLVAILVILAATVIIIRSIALIVFGRPRALTKQSNL